MKIYIHPQVGYAPLKSLEQLAPGALFLWMLLVHVCQTYRRLNPEMTEKKIWDFYIQVCGDRGLNLTPLCECA